MRRGRYIGVDLMKIKILDSPMGSGKTTYLIDYMNKNYQTKEFIYDSTKNAPYFSEGMNWHIFYN